MCVCVCVCVHVCICLCVCVCERERERWREREGACERNVHIYLLEGGKEREGECVYVFELKRG